MHGPHKLLDYLKREMRDNDEKATADCIAVEMDRYLRQGMLMYEWNSTLDKIWPWPNFEIKKFVTTYVGVNSWDDMNVEEKKKVYRAYEEDSPEVLTDMGYHGQAYLVLIRHLGAQGFNQEIDWY